MTTSEEGPGPAVPEMLARTLDLVRYPLDRPDSGDYRMLVERCRSSLGTECAFDLDGFLDPTAALNEAERLSSRMGSASHFERRRHNIYFLPRDDPQLSMLAVDHPALLEMETTNRTLAADQLVDSIVDVLYRWEGLSRFLADVLGVERLFTLADELAAVNVMSYRPGEALGWHFDRSEFTVTLLLRMPDRGGRFEYRTGLRHDEETDHEAVGRLVAGGTEGVRSRRSAPGTITVFAGLDVAHRVTAVEGAVDRMVAVLAFVERPDVRFSPAERLRFYGRSR